MLLVIGLDGATFDLLEPWLAAGQLPTLARLVARGVSGSLRSTLPPVTAPAWASFMTGKNPAGHGVFDFFRPHSPDLDRPQLVNAADMQARPLWDYLSAAGQRVGVLNVPLTYPPSPVNGFLVPGLLSPDEGETTYPPNFLRPYRAELGPYRLTPRITYHPRRTAAFIADVQAVTAAQIRYALRIAGDHPVDFLMVHFFMTDLAQHKLWRYLDKTHPFYRPEMGARFGTAVRDAFAQIDTALAALLDSLPGDTAVMVMSDHGFGPQRQVVNLNLGLMAAGLLALKKEVWVRLRAALARQPQAARWALRLLRLGGRERLLAYADVDWRQTTAYAQGHMGQVYLNVQGREPQGIVPPADYLAARARVMQALRDLREPATGRALVADVIPREAAGEGPYLAAGPDLHVIMADPGHVAYPMFATDGPLLAQQWLADSGNHRPEGILVASGPAFRHDRIHEARLIDLAPTILHLLGVAVPDDMDGRVLMEMFTDEFQQAYPVCTQPAAAFRPFAMPQPDEANALMAERLRALGYLG